MTDITGRALPQLTGDEAPCAHLCYCERAANRAEIERLQAAVQRMGIGVNHIASYRTDAWPDYGAACDVALEKLGAGREYDMWCCWNAAMCARDALTREPRHDPAAC